MPLAVTDNTPQELIDAIKGAQAFNPLASRDEFTANQSLWQLYLDLMELDRTKLQAMIDKLNDDETDTKLNLRKAMAAVFNLIPLVLDVIRLYIFSDEPTFDIGSDEKLQAFINDCDGSGTSFAQFVRQSALPLSLGLGWVDALVQNPLMSGDENTAADAESITPRVYAVTPLQRNNWSCQANNAYNWMTFKDRGNEPLNPLVANASVPDVYITLISAGIVPKASIDHAIWIRSQPSQRTRNARISGNGNGAKPDDQGLDHLIGYAPTARVPLATLYYKRSNDPARRHFGLSKIAIMAVLTRLIVNVLSWTTEDIKANLALLSIPVKGGRPPKNDDGSPAITALGAFSIIYSDAEKAAPGWVQGNSSHIDIKLKLCMVFLSEILRLAHLSDISGVTEQSGSGSSKPGSTSSGFHAIVNRNELFRELSDLSTALDIFSMDVLALAKSWITDADWDRHRLADEGKVKVGFYKGPWTMDPMKQIIDTASAIIAMFRAISPTLCTNSLKQTARAYLPQDDPDLETVLKEIQDKAGDELAKDSITGLLDEAAAILGSGGGISVSEKTDAAAAQQQVGAGAAPGETKPTNP